MNCSAEGTSASLCVHSPFAADNTLIVESNWAAASRVRCKVCGGCSYIQKRGQLIPETCVCHGAPEARKPESRTPVHTENNMPAQEISSQRITQLLALGDAIAKVTYSPSYRGSTFEEQKPFVDLTLMRPALIENNVYSPAESFRLYLDTASVLALLNALLGKKVNEIQDGIQGSG